MHGLKTPSETGAYARNALRTCMTEYRRQEQICWGPTVLLTCSNSHFSRLSGNLVRLGAHPVERSPGRTYMGGESTRTSCLSGAMSNPRMRRIPVGRRYNPIDDIRRHGATPYRFSAYGLRSKCSICSFKIDLLDIAYLAINETNSIFVLRRAVRSLLHSLHGLASYCISSRTGPI